MLPFGLNRIVPWLALLGVALAFWLIVSYAALLLEVASVLFAAFLLSLAIAPLADRLARWRIPRGLTVGLVYLLGGTLLVALAGLLVPVVRSEVRLLEAQGPQLVKDATAWLTHLPGPGAAISNFGQTVSDNLGQQLSSIAGSVLRALASAGGLALNLVIVAVLAYFFVTDRGLAGRLLTTWVPAAHQPRVARATGRLRLRLTRWLWAQALIALYFAVVYSLGLTVLGVPFALTIGIVGGLLEIVPYLGGALAVVLAVISALSVSPWLALWAIIFHIIVVELESHVIAPALYGRVIGVHPALMLIALLVGVKTGGVLGVFFAVPVTVVLLALVQELRRSDEPPLDGMQGPTDPAAGAASSKEA